MKYSKAKNLDIDPKLQEYLGKFRRLEDFRVDVSERSQCFQLICAEKRLVPGIGVLRSGPSCATNPGNSLVWVLYAVSPPVKWKVRLDQEVERYVVAPLCVVDIAKVS